MTPSLIAFETTLLMLLIVAFARATLSTCLLTFFDMFLLAKPKVSESIPLTPPSTPNAAPTGIPIPVIPVPKPLALKATDAPAVSPLKCKKMFLLRVYFFKVEL